MPKFFVNKTQIKDGWVTIVGEDAHHISRSLRMAAGERISVSDMQRQEYECVLREFLPDSVRAEIIGTRQADTEPEIKIHLYQALPKGEKLDLIIQKSVECGVFDITPFESERCVVKVKGDAEERKTERRNKIALEAAKQSGRGIVPRVYPTVSFSKMLEEAKSSDLALFCYEGEGTRPLGEILRKFRNENVNANDISIIIGSEGGFSQNEVATAESNGLTKTGLGKRILRTETAALFALSCLTYEFELS